MGNVLTLEQISARLGVPVATLRYWRHLGQGPRTFRLGRRVVALEADCEAWLQEQSQGASASGSRPAGVV